MAKLKLQPSNPEQLRARREAQKQKKEAKKRKRSDDPIIFAAKPTEPVVALESRLSSVIDAHGQSDSPRPPALSVPEPERRRPDPPLRRRLLQLEDGHSVREETCLIEEVADGLTSQRDKSIIEETAGEDILLDGIQKVLMAAQNMQVMRNNIAPLKAELKRVKGENTELKSAVRSLKGKMKTMGGEILFLSERRKKLEEGKEAALSALEAARVKLDRTKSELEQARTCAERVNFLETKARLYPLKKKKIYQEAVDTATLAERDRMKRLVLSGKTDWSPPASESEDSGSSSIDSGWDSELEAELKATGATASQGGETLQEPGEPDHPETEEVDVKPPRILRK